MRRINLGPFELDGRIGVGGAGEVWRARHVEQDVAVAIKVITARRARDERYQEAFRAEVKAVAGLGHPGVVGVLDLGTVDPEAAARSGGRLVAGSPYLAMELGRSSLRQAPRAAHFDELRVQLLWLLDVLAHSHARGVVHRDLKPGNVLVFEKPAIPGDVDGASRLRLADFGLAHAIGGLDPMGRGTAGTPTYMAPEQFRGRWREFGPPTDLYAFGCMAYALVAGHPPFMVEGVTDVMAAHLGEAPPPVPTRFPVPDGFDEWLGRLLMKLPENRFQRAADAAVVLSALGEPPLRRGAKAKGGPSLTDSATETLQQSNRTSMGTDSVAAGTRSTLFTSLHPDRRAAVEEVTTSAVPRRLPPFPARAPGRSTPRRSMRLVGAGLELFGLQSVPLVGREEETGLLWDTLASTLRDGDPRVVLLRGPAGTGKSRLADWLATEADAAGAALVVTANHAPAGGSGHGFGPMLARLLGCAGLSGEALERHLRRWARSRGALAARIERSLVGHLDAEGGGDSAMPAVERQNLVLAVLAIEAAAQVDEGAGRTVLMVLDDLQWGAESWALVSRCLMQTPEVPIVFIATVQEEALLERPEMVARLSDGLLDPKATEIRVGPLGADARRVLVRELLMLEGELAEAVALRSQGIPLFAIQLVGDWVRRGMLEVGTSGFRLRSGEVAAIPDSIHSMWMERVRRVLSDRDVHAIQLAAILGHEVEASEWRAALRVAGLEATESVVHDLIENRLAHVRESGFVFVHGMLRESLERSATEAERGDVLHLAAATALQIRSEAGASLGLAERVGRHFSRAGRHEEALAPLLAAAVERRRTSDYDGALALLDRRDISMDLSGTDESDPRRGQGWVLRAEILLCQGELNAAEAVANRVVRLGRGRHWDHLLAPALRHAAVAAGKRGRLTVAERRLARAVDAARFGSDPAELGRCLLFLGDVARLRGAFEVSVAHYRDAQMRFEQAGDLRGDGLSLQGMSAVYAAIGENSQALGVCLDAIARFEGVGDRFGVASARNALGDLHRADGRVREAREAYQVAIEGLEAVGSAEALVPRLNMALLGLGGADLGESERGFRAVLEDAGRSGRLALKAVALAGLVSVRVGTKDALAVPPLADELSELLAETELADAEIARLLDRAARDAALLVPRLARSLARIAVGQWTRLGQHHAASQLDVLLG